MRSFTSVLGILCLAGTWSARAGTPVEDLTAAATRFVGSLNEVQRAKGIIEFNSDERLNWHYVPKERKGIPLKELSPEQQQLALGALKAALSHEGFEKEETIRSLEDVLHEMEKQPNKRDALNYYVTVFGEPSAKTDWGLRFEGHHVSLHWTVIDGKIVSTFPQFFGANPAEVKQGPKQGTRVLAQEEDIARKLVKSLNDAQRKSGVVSDTAPPDILTGASREAAIQADTGISYHDLDKIQQGTLVTLIQVYANAMRPELAEERLQRLRAAGLDAIKFAWMGGVEKGDKHYYRIQGPTFLIEYDCTQDNANHIHTVWRDFHGDFGEDVLKEHYREHADPKHPRVHEH